ncbi:hypothetical protein [Methanoregula sp. UBA64]|jgi:hypothetical protein|uniref:hypothetical protein n=1 Tax=Methanoregula sp. UBA64 TaxID=1915554 RepID=UPI0025F0DDCD|nr:hypothetical protein [Methanoregula sp. UBA64]
MKRCIPVLIVVFLVILVLSAGCTDSAPPASGGSSATGTGKGGMSVNVSAMDSVLASTYLQMPDLNMTFIDFDITNPSDTARTVTVESEIQGYTEKAINTVEVPAHGNITVGQTPQLRTSAIPAEMTSATLHYKVALSDGTSIDEQTEPVKIYAKDTMVWSIYDGAEWNDMTPYIAAWVTPHAADIDPLVRKAANYNAGKSMTGYQCGDTCTDAEWEADTNAQVKAIFTALKNDYQITYVNSPLAYGRETEASQRVRLPAESISSKSANCIDGTVLYASAFESIGINPHIIVLPTHAFVCYDTKPNAAGQMACLETTMTGSSTFEEAAAYGDQEYQTEITNGNFKSGNSQDLSVAELRKIGILPMQ